MENRDKNPDAAEAKRELFEIGDELLKQAKTEDWVWSKQSKSRLNDVERRILKKAFGDSSKAILHDQETGHVYEVPTWAVSDVISDLSAEDQIVWEDISEDGFFVFERDRDDCCVYPLEPEHEAW